MLLGLQFKGQRKSQPQFSGSLAIPYKQRPSVRAAPVPVSLLVMSGRFHAILLPGFTLLDEAGVSDWRESTSWEAE